MTGRMFDGRSLVDPLPQEFGNVGLHFQGQVDVAIAAAENLLRKSSERAATSALISHSVKCLGVNNWNS